MNIATILLVWAFLDATCAGDGPEEKHHNVHLHHGRHHNKIKSRNNPGCLEVCEPELVAVTKWLNNTNELKLLYQLIPPSLKQAIPGLNATSPTNSSSSSLLNGLNLNSLYDSTAEWPIVSYFSKILGFWLSRAKSVLELFQTFPQFANFWRVVLRGLSGGCENSGALINNLKGLFGSNDTFGGNLFNFTYWESLMSPSGFIKGIEHAFENGFDAWTNITSLVSKAAQ